MNIGVFDSGLGGLTILKALLKELPQYNYVYLGDNARVPYGNRSPETIYRFTKEAVEFLFKKNCQLIIIACNTSTATSLHKIQQEYLPKFFPDRKVLGVIKPVVEQIKESEDRIIGVIGTKATINSEAFVREIKKVLPNTTSSPNSQYRKLSHNLNLWYVYKVIFDSTIMTEIEVGPFKLELSYLLEFGLVHQLYINTSSYLQNLPSKLL